MRMGAVFDKVKFSARTQFRKSIKVSRGASHVDCDDGAGAISDRSLRSCYIDAERFEVTIKD